MQIWGIKWSNLGVDFPFLPRYNLAMKQVTDYVEICLTILIYYFILKSERRGTTVPISKNERNVVMTDNEIKLINLIRENDNSEEAIITAVNVILSFLEQQQSSEVQAPAFLSALA